MDTGEFEIGQIKREVHCYHFNEVDYTYAMKHVPCKPESYEENSSDHQNAIYSYREQNGENLDGYKLNPEYVSTDKCNTRIKNENNIDIVYENIKCEIGEEKSSGLSNFCEVCCKSFSTETEFTHSKINSFKCSCQTQNDSISPPEKDVKPYSLILTADFRLQLPKVQDKKMSEDEYGNKQAHRDSKPLLKNGRGPTPNNISDDLLVPKRKYLSISAENNVFVNLQTTERNELETHKKIHTLKKPLSCKICSRTFKERRYLKAHETTHTVQKPFHCNICSKTFTEMRNLKFHADTHSEKKPFYCEICSETFIMTLNNFEIHERIHTAGKPFYCKVCSKYFTTSPHLKNHQTLHTGEKSYCCKICAKSFRTPVGMKKHEKTHTEETPFHSKICSKYFGSLQKLKIHERFHTGEKPYHCKTCSESFTNLQHLKIHERIHTEENHTDVEYALIIPVACNI